MQDSAVRPSISVAPSVSVALCTYNGERFIAEQLRSILHQTLMPAQVVVSDDGSSDATVQIVKDVFARFRAEHSGAEHSGSVPALTVLRNDHALGVTANFQQASLACTGELIALSDQDDLWVPNRLERMVAQFVSHPNLTLLHSDARLVDDNGTPLGGTLSEAIEFSAAEQRRIHSGQALDVLLRRNVVTGATTVFRRSLLESAVPFPPAWVHDEWLAIIAAITDRMDFLPEELTDYRQHASNQIGAAKPTLGVKVSRVREPRAERNRRLLARAQSLEIRLGEISEVSDRVRGLAEEKRRHEQVRSALPKNRVLRIVPVLWHALGGSYSRFGRARYDILRDLLQPDR